MLAKYRFTCLWVVLLLFCLQSYAQIKQVNSPYSISGIGDMQPTQFSFNRSMGGISAALRPPLNINYNNPASYGYLQLTTFELALQANSLWLQTNQTKTNTATGNLSYLAFAFPVSRFWAASFGLLPFSYLHYDINVFRNLPDIDSVNYRFIGGGQLYQVYVGNGFKFKGFSAGANIGYVFGTQTRQLRETFPALDNVFGNLRTQDIFPRGFVWNTGIQYNVKLAKKLSLTIGASGNAGINLNSTQNTRWERAQVANDRINVIDTLYLTEDEKGTIKLPAKLTAGFAFQGSGKSQWVAGADITIEPWENFRFYDQPDSTFTNNTRFATGFSVLPDARIFNSFWKSTTYSAGFYYQTGKFKINNTQLPEWAITLGVGMPLKRVNSRLNFSVEIGQRGSLKNNLIRETNMQATFGFTLNDKWFIKRKYD